MAGLLAGCGAPQKPVACEPTVKPDRWGVTIPQTTTDAGPHGVFEGTLLTLPEARTGTPDAWDNRQTLRLVINLLRNRRVHFTTYEFVPSEGGPQGRVDTMHALTEALVEVATERTGRPPRRGGVRAVLLHYDRGGWWRDGADCIQALLRANLPGDGLQIAVAAPHVNTTHRLDLTLQRSTRVAKDALPAALGRTQGGVTNLRIGDRTWSFPQEDDFDAAAFLAGANERWREIEAAMASHTHGAQVALSVAPEVKWAFVVTFLDIVLGSTSRIVQFPEEHFSLTRRAR